MPARETQPPPSSLLAPELRCSLARFSLAGIAVRLIAAGGAFALGLPTLGTLTATGAGALAGATLLVKRSRLHAALPLMAVEWWFQSIIWAIHFGFASNFQYYLLLISAAVFYLQSVSTRTRCFLAAIPIAVLMVDNWKLHGLPPLLSVPDQVAFALGQANLLIVLAAIAIIAISRMLHLDEERERAEQKAASAERLAASLSHELKTPLSSIITTAQSMLRYERSSDKYKHALSLCERNARSMSNLTRRIMDLVDAASDRVEPNWKAIDARDTLEQLLDVHHPIAAAKGVEIIAVCAHGQTVKTDEELLSIILNNLLANAIRYTPSGKSVVIRFFMKDHTSGLTVTDEGPGIKNEHLPHIFDAFFRGDQPRDRHQSNYGLGLALTSQIAAKLNITITVDSEIGHGATFRLQFPTNPQH